MCTAGSTRDAFQLSQPEKLEADIVVVVEAIDADHLVPSRQQLLANTRRDKAGCTCDEETHQALTQDKKHSRDKVYLAVGQRTQSVATTVTFAPVPKFHCPKNSGLQRRARFAWMGLQMAFDPRFLPRGHGRSNKSVPLHSREKLITALLAIWLVFLPWAFGTMHPWSQITSLVIAASAFAVAVRPRHIEDEGIILHPSRLLWRLPAFWLGLALLVYVAIQSLNPAWVWMRSETHWWLQKRESISWLPSGVAAPFDQMNGWRMIVIWAAPFLAGLAAWIGLTRRRAVQFLLGLFVVNATAVALLGIVQKYTGTNKIYWTYTFHAEVFGSFVYRNHGAAFLILALVMTLGLAMWHYTRGEEGGARSTPAPVYAFLAVLIGVALLVSTSRIGVILGAAVVLALLVVFNVRLFTENRARRVLPAITLAVVIGFAGWAAVQIDVSGLLYRMRSLQQAEGEASLAIRAMGADMARDMAITEPLWGVGAGAYRHLESSFGGRHPALNREIYLGSNGHAGVARYRMHDAHNDHLQLLAEVGIFGTSILVCLLAITLSGLLAKGRRHHAIAYSGASAVITLLVVATMDFPFQNPAILGSLTLLSILASKLSGLETQSAAQS